MQVKSREMAGNWDLTVEDGERVLWARARMLSPEAMLALATVLIGVDVAPVGDVESSSSDAAS